MKSFAETLDARDSQTQKVQEMFINVEMEEKFMWQWDVLLWLVHQLNKCFFGVLGFLRNIVPDYLNRIN